MSLTVNIATRGRPHLLPGTIKSMVESAERPDTTIMVSVDDDDHPTIKALGQLAPAFDKRVKVSVKPREDSVAEKWDRMLSEHPAQVYMVGVDYELVKTPAFDTRIIEAAKLFPDGVGCIYGPMANASFPSLQACTAKLVELMGGFYPRHWPFWFVDHWLDDIVRMTGRFVYADIDIDCNSRRPSKTSELRDLLLWASLYDSFWQERRKIANAIIDHIQESDWRKDMLRRNFSLQEYRSRWVNLIVRGDAANISAQRGSSTPPDERYLRIKAKAEQLLLANYQELEAA